MRARETYLALGRVCGGSIFVFEILEKKWWVLSKEEERRRGSGLRKIHEREGEGEGEGERERKCG